MKKRILSLLATLCLTLIFLPTTVFAADSYGPSNVHGIECYKTYCRDTYFTLDIPAEHLREVVCYRVEDGSVSVLQTDEYGYYKLDAGLGAINVIVRWETPVMQEEIRILSLTVK